MSAADSTKCPKCGGFKKPEFELCFKCSQQQRGGGRPGGSRPEAILPPECVFKSFYGADGYLRPEIFIQSAEKAAKVFEEDGMTQTSFRSFFNMLKSMEQRLRAGTVPQGEVNENFLRFVRQVEYQVKRNVIKDTFKQFVDAHRDVVLSSVKEFKGFVEYLSSILARLRTK